MELIIITEWSCQFEKELPIKAIPLICGNKKIVAVKSIAGWVAKIDTLKFEAPCKKVELPIRAYIKNVIIPSINGLDLTPLENCIACDASGDCRPLHKWVVSCHTRRVIVYATVPLEFVAAYVKLRSLYAFSKNSIKAGNCKFKLKKDGACMQCTYESERGIRPEFVSNLQSLLSVLAPS